MGDGSVFDSRVRRRRLLFAAALAAAVARAGVARAQAKPEKPKLVMAVGARMSLQHLPLTIAERLGFFVSEGLDVEILDLGNGLRAQQALVEAAADVACGAFDGMFNPLARKQSHRAFVLLGRAPQIAFGVSTRTLPAYRKVGDLKGRNIGIAAPGSSALLVAGMVLARAGLSTQDVRFVETGNVGAALQAIRSGQVDAMVHMEPVMTMLEQKGDVRVISDTRSLKGSHEVFGGAMPATCMYAPTDYLQNHPNTAQALTNAAVHALKWLQTAGPSDLIKAVPEAYLLGDRGLYLTSFGKIRESIALDGVIPEDGVKNASRVIGRLQSSPNADKQDLDRLFTNTFALKAKEKFRA